MKVYKNIFNNIISLENLFSAWDDFKQGKRHKKDVQKFEFALETNIFKLHKDLQTQSYQHDAYMGFFYR